MAKTVTFPILRSLMARFGLTQKDLSVVISCNQNTFSRKLNCIQDFKLFEMVRIVQYLRKLGCELGVEAIFYDWILTKVTDE